MKSSPTPSQLREAFDAMEREQREEYLDHLRRCAEAAGRCTTCKRLWCVCKWRTGDA